MSTYQPKYPQEWVAAEMKSSGPLDFVDRPWNTKQLAPHKIPNNKTAAQATTSRTSKQNVCGANAFRKAYVEDHDEDASEYAEASLEQPKKKGARSYESTDYEAKVDTETKEEDGPGDYIAPNKQLALLIQEKMAAEKAYVAANASKWQKPVPRKQKDNQIADQGGNDTRNSHLTSERLEQLERENQLIGYSAGKPELSTEYFEPLRKNLTRQLEPSGQNTKRPRKTQRYARGEAEMQVMAPPQFMEDASIGDYSGGMISKSKATYNCKQIGTSPDSIVNGKGMLTEGIEDDRPNLREALDVDEGVIRKQYHAMESKGRAAPGDITRRRAPGRVKRFDDGSNYDAGTTAGVGLGPSDRVEVSVRTRPVNHRSAAPTRENRESFPPPLTQSEILRDRFNRWVGE